MSADGVTQVNDLFVEFFGNKNLTAADAQKRFVDIIAAAD